MADNKSAQIYREVVVLTGEIGAGKSTAGGIFSDLGATVVDADSLARDVVAPGSKTLQAIVENFGKEILNARGALKRDKLGSIVFNNPEKRKVLEQLTHPAIRELSIAMFRKALQDKAPLIVYECPLFFGTDLETLEFKKVILVCAEKRTRKNRISERDELSSEQIENRIAAREITAQQKAKADFIIENSGSFSELRKSIEEIFDKLTN